MSSPATKRPETMASDTQPPTKLPSGNGSDDTLDPGRDFESQTPSPVAERVSHWRIVSSQSLVTDAVLKHPYRGLGTAEDPYLVEFIPNDPRDPMAFPAWKKWSLILTVALTTLAVAFVSTAYTGSIEQIMEEFHCSQEIATLGISLFVLGWAIGPLVSHESPLSACVSVR